MRSIFIKSILLTFIFSHYSYATIITFFIRPYPIEDKQISENDSKFLNYPGKLSAKILKKNFFTTRQCQGIFATYQGYITFSDLAGQCIFPQKSSKKSLKMLITESITPVFMLGNTIHHWQINPLTPAKLFYFEKIYDNQTKKMYWRVSEKSLGSDSAIDLNTIVLFAKPKDIYVPTGNFITEENANSILPYIYAKKNLNNIHPALWIIKIRQFFKPITEEIKKESSIYYMKRLTS